MKFRFKSIELLILTAILLEVGFTAGCLVAISFNFDGPQLITEKMILIASFGVILPFLLAIYMISRGIWGYSPAAVLRRGTKKRRIHQHA